MSTIDTTSKNGKVRPGPVCAVCPLYQSCRSVCEPVEKLLPSLERARVDAEDLPRLYQGIRLTNLLLDNLSLLTPHQQEVVRLYYRESLQQQEIASILNVSQQAVNDALQRARLAVGRAYRKPVPVGEGATAASAGTKALAAVGSRNAGAATRARSRLPDNHGR